jgi:Bacterial alpha-L-rhamnosidase 6 hairpin glycosidase domain/Alpha-L-rhamnosidase N-terminal domain/Bacterial alpha-L-rhamnosidase concanavalin-like domain/Bacterial alpha-L-rhamnosidase C-terminal domain/Domain of unknown function (DUF3395)
MLQSTRRGDRQIAYQVLVASSQDLLSKDQGDLWDSGKVDSDESAHVVYQGKTLVSEMSCYWKVRVWSALDREQPQYGAVTHWTMGLLNSQDWKGKWIDSSAASKAEAAKEPITILHAVYEPVPPRAKAGAKPAATSSADSLDVTSVLAALVKDGTIEVVVNNTTMGKDPAPDKHKQLVVEYLQSGKTMKTTVKEESTLTLPLLGTRLWYFRKTFEPKAQVQSAVLYVTALGLYEFHINGQRVGDHLLAPDWTDYNVRVDYQAYDVTSLLKSGNNALAAQIARGWYAGHLGNGGFQQYGKIPALLAQMRVTYTDGSSEWVTTDSSWKIHQSPILASDFMLGETCDARTEVRGWDQLQTTDDGWTTATHREAGTATLVSQVAPPVRETGQIKPIALSEPAPGHWTFDMGQNMVGVVRLKVSSPSGTIITLHHAEMLNPDGTVYTTNLRGAPSVDVYTTKGGIDEIWQPKFTFHGFRYVELTGLNEKPTLDTITGIVIGSDTPRTGSFECSDSRINQLMSNIQWGQRGNYLSVPTDCPQRDERLGWMGDAQVFVRTATCNADVAAFFSKWLVDVDDAQTPQGAFTDVSPARGTGAGTPAWGDAGVICPWTIYLAYGDKRILEKHLPAMTKWVDWCKEHSTDLIRSDKQFRGGDYGDWLSIKANTPKDLIGTAYFAYSAHLLAQSYAAVGNEPQAQKYQQLFDDIKAAFNKEYVQPDGRIKGDTQCCYLMALKFDLLPENLRAAASQFLVDDIQAKQMHLSTGFVGVSYLLPMLAQTGKIDTAYTLLLQDTFPSWLFSVKHGATTIWERWDGWTPDNGFQNPTMNSFNHYSLGSCGEWLYDSVAGINWDPAQPGYKHVIIRPQLPSHGELTYAKATIGSPCGSISSGWKLEGDKLSINLALPPNTTATVYIPASPNQAITESGKQINDVDGIKFLRDEKAVKVYEVQSGTYSFNVSR